MTGLLDDIKAMAHLREAQGGKWSAIKPEYAARMRAQNRFHTGLDIARYTAKIMRDDMAAYDADTSQYTQSLGCWHGFIGQQKLISIKKHFEHYYHRICFPSKPNQSFIFETNSKVCCDQIPGLFNSCPFFHFSSKSDPNHSPLCLEPVGTH